MGVEGHQSLPGVCSKAKIRVVDLPIFDDVNLSDRTNGGKVGLNLVSAHLRGQISHQNFVERRCKAESRRVDEPCRSLDAPDYH